MDEAQFVIENVVTLMITKIRWKMNTSKEEKKNNLVPSLMSFVKQFN